MGLNVKDSVLGDDPMPGPPAPVIIPPEIELLLGVDPVPLEDLFNTITSPVASAEDRNLANIHWSDCCRLNREQAFLKAVGMLTASTREDRIKELWPLVDMLEAEDFHHWDRLSHSVQETIRRSLILCLQHEENLRLVNLLKVALTHVALFPVRYVGGRLNCKPWGDLFSFMLDSLYSESNKLQKVSLFLMEYASKFVCDIVASYSAHQPPKLMSILNRMDQIFQSDDNDLKVCALRAVVQLWRRLSDERPELFEDIVTLIHRIFPWAIQQQEDVVEELLLGILNKINIFLNKMEHVNAIMGTALGLAETEGARYSIRRTATSLFIALVERAPAGWTMVSHIRRFVVLVVEFMSELDEVGDWYDGSSEGEFATLGQHLHLHAMFKFEKITTFCPALVLESVNQVLGQYVSHSDWKRRYAAGVAIQRLFKKLPPEMHEILGAIVIEWNLQLLKDVDLRIKCLATNTFLQAAPFFKVQPLVTHNAKIRMAISVQLMTVSHDEVKARLCAARDKLL